MLRHALVAPYHPIQDAVYLRNHVSGDLYPRGAGVAVDLLGPRATDDRAAHVLLAEHPRERELRHAEALIGGYGAQPLHGREHLLVHELLHKAVRFRVGGAGALLGGIARTILAGKDALGERREDHLADAFVLAKRYDLALYSALDHVVLRLVRDYAIQVHLTGDPHGLGDLVLRPLGDADVEDFPLSHEIVEHPERLLQGRVLIVAVALVEVDVVGPESL